LQSVPKSDVSERNPIHASVSFVGDFNIRYHKSIEACQSRLSHLYGS
jgi:hypothetical protein